MSESHSTGDHYRDPCPLVIVNDFGGAFAMGVGFGAIWHGIKGFRNSPYGERWQGSKAAIRLRAPTLGGSFGAWGGTFSTWDCIVKGIRKTEDPWNAIISGFMTGGTLAIRGGVKSAAISATFGGIILGAIEGAQIAMSRVFAPAPMGAAPGAPETLQA